MAVPKTVRWPVAVVLLLLGALLGVLASVAGFVRGQVLDTDAYVRTVAPLASDPVVRDAVAQRLTNEIVTRADVAGVANEAAEQLVARGAPARITGLVTPLVEAIKSFLYGKIQSLLENPEVQQIWEQVNRLAHTAVVTVLTGREGEILQSNGTTVTIDLGPLLQAVQQRLVAQGLTILNGISIGSVPYTLVESDRLPSLRKYARLLDTLATWLPYLALVLLLGGILVAPNRRRGILTGALCLGGLALLFQLGIVLMRQYYVDNLPPAVQSVDAATNVFNTIVRFLVASLWVLVTVAAIFVVGALLTGPSRPARWVRRPVDRGLDASAKVLPGWVPMAPTVRKPLLISLVLLSLFVCLIFRPSLTAVLWLAAGTLLAMAVVEIVARRASLGELGRASP